MALDVNKRVVYARNEEGKVLGRQLIAVSEAGELICFSVYPESAPGPLVAAFADYDHALAEQLGLPIRTDHRYQIANVLSVELWDDGAWDPSADAR